MDLLLASQVCLVVGVLSSAGVDLSRSVVMGLVFEVSGTETLIFSHCLFKSQRSSFTISSEFLSFAEDVVPLVGFHLTSLYTKRAAPVNHFEAPSPY